MPAAAQRHGSARADLAMLLVVVIWGGNIPVIKSALAQIPTLAFAGIRFALASVAFVLLLRGREGSVRPPAGTGWAMLWLGLLGNTAYQLLFMTGLSHTSVANTALILASTPVLVAVFGAASGIERLTPAVAGGVALAVVGVALVLGQDGARITARTLAGDLPVLGAAACWAVYTLGVRRYAPTMSPLRLTTLTMLTGTPILVLAGLPDILRTDWATVSPGAWGGVAYSAFLALLVAYTLWNTSVAEVGPSRTAVYNCLVPVVALALGWLTLGERPGAFQLAGAVLIVSGVLVARNLPREGAA
ncbi:MAG TPA: DMT family transporter [Gemmatimonadales bacterium]|nr:DMT family transporter [Gemmatimonadales bacterium]